MKILILQDDFRPYEKGGAGLIAGLIADMMVKYGHQVFVITTVQDKTLEGKSSLDGMVIYRIYSNYSERFRSYRSLYNWTILRKVDEIMKEVKPDVVHAHNIHYHISYHSLALAYKYTKNIFLTAHDIMSFYQGTFTEFIDKKDLTCPTKFNYKVTPLMLIKAFKKRYNPLHNYIVKLYLKKVKKIVAVSYSLQDALNQNGIKNTTVIHNGLDSNEYHFSSEDIAEYKKKNNLSGSDIVIFGGRLSGAKGGDLILQAIADVYKVRKTVKLIIFGKKGFYTDKILSRSKELGIQDNIDIVGWNGDDELKKQYSISDVAVTPSVCFDSFPTTNLIAFSCSKPVIATCFGGSREIVKDGENGYIVNPFNVGDLSKKILYLLENKDIAKKFGENGHDLLKREFTQEKTAQSYLSIFSK